MNSGGACPRQLKDGRTGFLHSGDKRAYRISYGCGSDHRSLASRLGGGFGLFGEALMIGSSQFVSFGSIRTKGKLALGVLHFPLLYRLLGLVTCGISRSLVFCFAVPGK
jgi:hypothetical protein